MFKGFFDNFIHLTLLFSCVNFVSLEGCTGIRLSTIDHSFVVGRTLEFGVEIDVSIAMIPRGYKFYGTTSKGKGLDYSTKYACLGAIAYGQIALLDGINEKGLTVETFYFPGFASYTPLTDKNQNKALSPLEFPHWLLTQFSSIAEIKNALSEIVIVPTKSKDWGDIVPPFHYIVYDNQGECLVIEPSEEKLNTFDNPTGVLTNSPNFEWHLTNLRNYINLTNLNAPPLKLNGLTLSPFGQGSGMVGMPGDFTPPSRFVRAFIFSITAIPPKNAEQGVFQLFHILNQFDIPKGAIKEKVNEVVYMDYTMITAVKNPQSLDYYFRTYDDQTIRMVNLKQFNPQGTQIRIWHPNSKEKAVDVSSSFTMVSIANDDNSGKSNQEDSQKISGIGNYIP